MKNLLVVLSLIIFTTDSFASGIASNTNSAPCTNNTLETYSGNSNLSADWQPNEIQLRWYNGNTLMNVQSSANTCVYDGNLSIPSTAPTRTGYTFDGWTVRPEIDFVTTIPLYVNGDERFAKSNNGCKYHIKTSSGSAVQVSCDNDDFKELREYEWKVKFNHGTLYGMSGCSTTSGERGEIGNPIIGSGEYCWCKATGYKAINSDTISAPSATLPWVFYSSGTCAVGEAGCRSDCANVCGNSASVSSLFRATLFTPAQ